MVQIAYLRTRKVSKWLKDVSKQYTEGVEVRKSQIKTDFEIPNNQATIVFQLLIREGYILNWTTIGIPPSKDYQEHKEQEITERTQKKEKALLEEQEAEEAERKGRTRIEKHKEELRQARYDKARKAFGAELHSLEKQLEEEKKDSYNCKLDGGDCDNCVSKDVYSRCPSLELVNRIAKLKREMGLEPRDEIELPI